jgi:hypothetical protein
VEVVSLKLVTAIFLEKIATPVTSKPTTTNNSSLLLTASRHGVKKKVVI